MGLFGRRRLPASVDAALGRRRGERVLAFARDERTDGYVVATTTRLSAVPAGASVPGDKPPIQALSRSWHEVAGGAWEPMTETISVSWVDGGRAAQWSLRDGGARFAEVFHDRVASSVIIDAPVDIDGRNLGRVAIRRDLATGDTFRQVAWSRGPRQGDPAADAYAQRLLDDLAEQAGMR